MPDLFARERELCLLFIKNRKENVSIDYSISNKSVDVIVRYKRETDWDAVVLKKILIVCGIILI